MTQRNRARARLAGEQTIGRGSDDGSFKIPNVRPGTYQLHAISDGVLGAYDATASVTIAPGQKLDLGTIEWHPTHFGKQIWQIGTPNRSAKEFLKGDDHWHWGMYIEYAKLFPNDVVVLGANDVLEAFTTLEHNALADGDHDRADAIRDAGEMLLDDFKTTGGDARELAAALREVHTGLADTIVAWNDQDEAWLDVVGLNPTLEALSAQLLVIVFALATYSVVQRNARLAREDKAAMRTVKP